MLPNLVTLLALCAGLTAIRMGVEGRFELAVGAIVFAAILDGIDGRVARLLKSQSDFGSQLDSLADFVNFGVAPGMVLYFWRLEELGSFGWIVALVFAICGALRLARFNAALSGEPPPAWQGDFFVGVPAPAGALTVLLPLSLWQIGLPVPPEAAILVAFFTVAIGLLMVSRLPTYSGKRIGAAIPREAVLPVLVICVGLIALIVSYTFWVLSVGALAYLAHLPWALRKHEMRREAHARERAEEGETEK
ncbi:CDP-diacylglycerol--serine O-phosphatidyltransferase [Afifella sp. IM 167]|uniref:CDP-diacylglycerol--serine O-phosphatidyltransferase n=1 Tax=Afifella sp. IM 167 TaxID=2033586 RepID=UPI00351CEF2A